MAATFNAEPLPPVAASQVTSRPAAASVGGAVPIGGVAADGALGAHEAALDPHPQYETASEVTAKVTAHSAASDPHGDRAYADGKFLPRLVSATKRLLGLGGTAPGNAEELTLSSVLDWVGSVARGDILFRGATGWSRLPAGTAGQVLQTGGTSGDPTWVTPSGGVGGGGPDFRQALILRCGLDGGVAGANLVQDSSGYGRSVSSPTSATLSSAAARFGALSLLLPGSSPPRGVTPELELGSCDFTIAGWWMPPGGGLICSRGGGATGWALQIGAGAGSLRALINGVWSDSQIVTPGLTNGVFNHVAMTRRLDVIRIFIGGALAGSLSGVRTMGSGYGALTLGAADDFGENAIAGGFVGELIVLRGQALWTAPFTPPTSPFSG